MALDESGLQRVIAALRRAREMEWPRLATIRRYMLNEACDIYVPKEATDEYKMLVDQARFNVLPLVVTAVAQNLFVDGYRPTAASGRAPDSSNSPIWDTVWQANRMDARQAGLYRGAITYGYSYATVLPGTRAGEPAPKITPWSPLRLTALYEDPVNDEWPRYAMTVDQPEALTRGQQQRDPNITAVVGPVTVRVYDNTHVYKLRVDATQSTAEAVSADEHGLGVTPVVRYVDVVDLDGCSLGKVEPLLPVQRQLNQTTFSLLMTQNFQAFRQRWATGMAIEEDEQGNPKEPWNALVNAVWQNESPDGRFGDFAEANLSGYLESRDKALLYVASAAQIPPHNLLVGAGISNISAEALAALESGHRHDIAEHQTSFGESTEQTLRLAGLAMGDEAGRAAWEDTSAQVVWRDTTPRSLAQVADALGKLATQLGIPVQALWEWLPGATDQDIARWKDMVAEQDAIDQVMSLVRGSGEEEVGSEGVAGAIGAGEPADAAA